MTYTTSSTIDLIKNLPAGVASTFSDDAGAYKVTRLTESGSVDLTGTVAVVNSTVESAGSLRINGVALEPGVNQCAFVYTVPDVGTTVTLGVYIVVRVDNVTTMSK